MTEETKTVVTEKKVSELQQEVKPKHILGIIAIFVVVFMFMGGDESSSTSSQPQTTQNTISPEAQENARKELKELMKLSMEAGLVRSYEFSDTANVVFVGNAWYAQEVPFKKDFMAKIALLKKTATGYQHYELHDANSDEKVAEVTAFSGALEVYK